MGTHAERAITGAFAGNPFHVADGPLHAGEAALAEVDIAGALTRRLDAGDLMGAKALLLAVGHAEALAAVDAPARVLAPPRVPAAIFARLPRPRGAYLRVVMAAARCHRALQALAGTSARVRALRRHVWSACFGDSLLHALELEPLIRDHDVVVLGETGTGKELVAHAILAAVPGAHDGRPAPQATLNAAAIPETLIESELFGHVKGAFTGATEARAGRIRHASGGARFLDEVGDLPVHTQVKLLRVIETNEVHPVGADGPEAVDLRYVTATHKDLVAMVDRGVFRQDLYERLAGHVIRLPPLRERPEDIPAIGRRFVEAHLGQARIPGQAHRVLRWLESPEAQAYPWPGNVRELQNALRNLLLGLQPGLRGQPTPALRTAGVPLEIATATATMRAVQDWYSRRVLAANDDNQAATARALGVDRSTLKRWLRR